MAPLREELGRWEGRHESSGEGVVDSPVML